MRRKLQLDPTQAQQKISDLRTEQDGFCLLSVLKPTKENGYIQLSSEGANKYALLHEILIWAKGEHAPDNQHISHLCDKPRCALKEHVVVESPAMNNSRKNCGKIVNCAHCPKKYIACDHDPKCITYVEGFDSWNDFLARGLHE